MRIGNNGFEGGKIEEAQMWQEKANALDQEEQQNWRNRVATSIVRAPWGANEAIVDQVGDARVTSLPSNQCSSSQSIHINSFFVNTPEQFIDPKFYVLETVVCSISRCIAPPCLSSNRWPTSTGSSYWR